MKRAFTLIELLVVVLIIGILSSIALPQYQLAVAKARAATVLPILKNLHDADQVYYLANEAHATDLRDLDVDLPAGGSYNENYTIKTYPKQEFRLCIHCQSFIAFPDLSGLSGLYIEFYHNNYKYCFARKVSSLENKVCKAISGKSEPAGGDDTMNGYLLKF